MIYVWCIGSKYELINVFEKETLKTLIGEIEGSKRSDMRDQIDQIEIRYI